MVTTVVPITTRTAPNKFTMGLLRMEAQWVARLVVAFWARRRAAAITRRGRRRHLSWVMCCAPAHHMVDW